MAKRWGEFDQKNNKKIKLDDDIEALWGDDLDEDALDDCIKLASQVLEKEQITCTQLNNVTLLPTYNAFKDRKSLFSSTQLTQPNNISVRPSTSKYEFVPKKPSLRNDLQKEMSISQEQYKEKEGEISILRIQLQETKTNLQNEQQKLKNEWKQKLTQTEKQMKSVKSELEFKNLEIANLKQKILEITKHNLLDTSLNSIQHATTSKINEEKPVANEVNTKSKRLQPILEPIYPLKGVVSSTIFNIPKREQHVIQTKLTHPSRNAIPYLQNQSLAANIAIDKSDFNIDCVYPDILKLIYTSEAGLDDKENIVHINHVVCACEQFMYNLEKFLGQIKGNLRTEDILQADSRYLKCQNSDLDPKDDNPEKDEIGVKSGVLLNILAELLPYSLYLKNYICQNKSLDLHEKQKDTLRKKFPYRVIKERSTEPHYFLHMVLNIIRIAGEIRKVDLMSKFLCATIKLLINIHKSRNYDYVSDIFCKLTKEIIISRPTVKVICQITYLFKVASQHSSFIEFLLNKSQNSISSKKGILYFNGDACRFYIFVMLFDNSIFRLGNERLPLKVCLNLLCFMYNTFNHSHWIHHRDTKECECISQLYKLEIEIISRALDKYVEEKEKKRVISSEWSHFFKHPIATKVLNLMTFNSYDLTEKYITALSQFKQIEKRLQEDSDLIQLEKLNISDEMVEIPNDAFKNVDF